MDVLLGNKTANTVAIRELVRVLRTAQENGYSLEMNTWGGNVVKGGKLSFRGCVVGMATYDSWFRSKGLLMHPIEMVPVFVSKVSFWMKVWRSFTSPAPITDMELLKNFEAIDKFFGLKREESWYFFGKRATNAYETDYPSYEQVISKLEIFAKGSEELQAPPVVEQEPLYLQMFPLPF